MWSMLRNCTVAIAQSQSEVRDRLGAREGGEEVHKIYVINETDLSLISDNVIVFSKVLRM